METKIARRDPILLAGMGFFGNPFSSASPWDEENEIGSLWKRFMAFLAENPGAIAEKPPSLGAWYEIHIPAPETPKTGRYEVFVGVEARSVERLPLRCSAKYLPGAEYAVVTARGAEISSDWLGRLYSEIVPSLGRKADESFSFELYDSRFKGMDRILESEMEYYFPLLSAAED